MSLDPRELGELQQRRQRYGRIRLFGAAGFVAVLLLTLILVVAGGKGGSKVSVPLPDASFAVEMLRLNGEPAALVKNGGHYDVLRMLGPGDADVGYCDSARVFVAPDADAVYDMDGVVITGADIGLERLLFEPTEGGVEIDTSSVGPAFPAGVTPAVSIEDPAVQDCVANPDDLEFVPTS